MYSGKFCNWTQICLILSYIDNNDMENAIRSLAIGRKNCLFSDCKAQGVDVRSWLEFTLKRIPTEKAIDQLMPTTIRHYLIK